MSHATQPARQSGPSKRRRSRSKKRNYNNKNQQQDSPKGHNSSRLEEFRPQSLRTSRAPAPVKLSWWQKILKLLGLYKAPTTAAPTKPFQKDKTESRPPKSNIRIARTDSETSTEKSGKQRTRAERPRGGDKSTVESARLYVGNLSYDVTEQDLKELFKGVGGVRSAEIVYNRTTHRSKGYGFVEMLNRDEAKRSVEVLHDQHFMGRKMIVSGAKSKGMDEREEKDEPSESRPIVVAPLPEASKAEEPAQKAPAAEEPTIKVVMETATETCNSCSCSLGEEPKEKTQA